MGQLDAQIKVMEAAEAKADLGRFRNISGAWRVLFLAFTALGILLSVNQIFNIKFFVEFVILDNSYLYLLSRMTN